MSAHEDTQGIHPPAPVYLSNQPSERATYYFAGSSSTPAGYYVNGLYYGLSPLPTATASQPFTIPTSSPWSQTTPSAPAAAVVAANVAYAQIPHAPAYFIGTTAAEIQAQNAIPIAYLVSAQQSPSQFVPYKPGSSPQFWCKELDGSWTLREYNDTLKSDFPAGH
ncbi:uncharacterized protein Z518_00195 [Rhinocladiella mackenziei CBS 650.93]|uniref:Uncharacterized protein n=1 Tax=Rhinocladiella mackenziei CBS 650.93 TaxID=1442369 RepID=A0A0D2G3H0_9EURO|nr:uncharacterized protein Z518_00195 [Rhinocladiella mackenziei CBS 650.93]KIX09117.1 hypothetical protein Z518_00195 [Rhinocladiella mackenziei CBS 650.93]